METFKMYVNNSNRGGPRGVRLNLAESKAGKNLHLE